MERSVSSSEGRVFPLWIKIPATLIGVIFAGFGMSRVFSGAGFRDVLVPTAVGAIMIFVSGFEKRLGVDEDGVTREKSFWGQHRTNRLKWDELSSVRIILGKGQKVFVLPHADKPVWPMSFKRDDEEAVLSLIQKHMPEDKIIIER